MSRTSKDIVTNTKNLSKDNKNGAKSKPKKKNNSKTQEETSTDGAPNTDDNDTTTVPPLKIEPKRKREPLVPRGEWVFPEMESVLHAVHERLRMKIGTLTYKYFSDDSSDKKEIPVFEESDNNLPKIDVDKILVRLSNGEVYESPR